MGREYGPCYHFKGENCTVGNMICAECGKGINNKQHDWVHCTKSLKHDDWKFVCRHRGCVANKKGWVTIENKEALVKSNAEKISKFLNEFKDNQGRFDREVYLALEMNDLD